MFEWCSSTEGAGRFPWAVILIAVLVVTAGCAGLGNDSNSDPSTTVTRAPGADDPGSLAGTTTTVDRVNGSLPYRLTVQNDLERNITITATYATNATTAVSSTYAPQSNASLAAELQPDRAYEVVIRSGNHTLWSTTLAAGEGYQLVITEWGRVTVEAHVRAD